MTDNHTINELLNRALIQWVALTGVDLTNTSWVIRGSDGVWSNYNLQKYTQQVEDARDLDETGLTAFMMLRGVFESYCKDLAFSAYELMLDPMSVNVALEPIQELRNILENHLVVTLISEFQQHLREAAKHYGREADESYGKWVDSKLDLSFIRRDALLAMEKLQAHQFTQGEPAGGDLGVNLKVLEFWNVNSLLRAMRTQGMPGLTLCLMRDPEALWSYFVFAVKNGDTITVLTDKAQTPHPAHKSMSRARAVMRGFEERAGKFWFPYKLLDIEVAANQKDLYAKARTALVPLNAEAVVLSELKELDRSLKPT